MGSTHKKRRQQIANIALPPKGTNEYDLIIELLQKHKNKENDKYIQAIFKQSSSIFIGQQLNGAGHHTDQAIRHFHNEYNYRCWNHGLLYSFPSSFNVAESFFYYHPELNTFIIRDELNYLFSFPDFVDWYTSCNQSSEYHDALDNMEEGVIYTFDNLIDPAELLYDIENGGEIAVSGFATVRFGTEVTVMCVGGENTNIEQKNQEVATRFSPSNIRAVKFKNDITPDPARPVEAVTLDSKLPLWKLLAFIRFDTEDMSQSLRYLFHDIGYSFLITSNDPAAVFDIKGEPIYNEMPVEDQLAHNADKTKGYNALFDLCASALFLPLYFNIHADDVVIERYKTDYDKKSRKTSFQKIKKNIPIKQRIAYRNVNILRGQNNERDCRETIYSAQNFHMETSGYWRTLQPGKYGTDKKGNPVHGRTWISKKLSWMEADEPSVLKAKGYTCRSLPEGPNPGYIYIMREPVHEKDVFKIGLTTRSANIRANELSSATGVPGRIYVINQWPVSDCKTIETKIHNQLAEYRVDPRREFFQGSLEHFIKTVNSTIRELEEF